MWTMREGDYTPRQEHQQELSLGSGTCGLHSCTSPKFPVSFIVETRRLTLVLLNGVFDSKAYQPVTYTWM